MITSRNIYEIIEIDWENFVMKHPKLFNEIFKRVMENFEKNLAEMYRYKPKDDEKEEEPKPVVDEIYKDFEKMFFTKKYADVVFEVEGNQISAHKIILSGKIFLFF
jgi:hypothetical protein